MQEEQSRFSNYCTQMSVCIEQRENYDYQGVLIHDATGRAWRFCSIVQMIQIYESFCNSIGYPQSTHQLRSLSEKPRDGRKGLEELALPDEEVPLHKPTFVIQLKYRQNASWQGSIRWIEGNVERNFRSMLELLKLIEGAIGSKENIGWE